MAEAHSAVAFSFSVTPDGLDVRYNHEALKAVWYSGVRSWKKRIGRMKNNFHNGVYPASPASWILSAALVVGFHLAEVDLSFGLIQWFSSFSLIQSLEPPYHFYTSMFVYATLLWLTGILMLRYTLKALLMYTGWMFEARGKMSTLTKIWLGIVKLMVGRKPLLYSYQGSLPTLPVPSLNDTMKRYLLSVRPLMTDEKFARMEKLVEEFRDGIGKKLQRYLVLKSWWATNYVSDWWEDYVYLRGRSPIMVNSNYYAVDAVFRHPTTIQVARAANIVYSILQFRRHLDREELPPIMLNKTVPLCSWQYERQFNTTRVPGIETDALVHHQDSKHIVVYHKGRYYKVYIYYKHQLLQPCQIQIMLQKIIDDPQLPVEGEEELAALTAGDRIPWARARVEYFSKGVNKTSLDAIEKAAFVVALDTEEQNFDRNDPSKLDKYGQAMLYGNGCNRWFDKSFTLVVTTNGRNDPSKLDKYGQAMLYGNGCNRWFDKSFTLVVTTNGRIGFNAEHSWADAPVMANLWEDVMCFDMFNLGADAPAMAHLWELSIGTESTLGYREDGHTKGQPEFAPPNPIKLQWELSKECRVVIDSSLSVARDLYGDVDLRVLMHDQYGKGFIKRCNISPDAFIQMALQLAYYRDAGKFSLTYEASMTRLFREGRTETVRSCTVQSSEFARAMDDHSIPVKEKVRLLHAAGETHQEGYRNAMTGCGIDRHLFCLYVVSKYLGIESALLKEVLSEPWRLSTSQTPHQQTDKLDLVDHPDLISAGGGFGPVADDGYGVSYIIAGEDVIFFHISSKKSCPVTDSQRFGQNIVRALDDMRNLFS